MAWTDDEIKGKILHKLTRKGKFEHSHTAIELLQSGFPKDQSGRVKSQVEALKKEGILHVKRTNYGEHVSINLEMNEQVSHYIEKFLSRQD